MLDRSQTVGDTQWADTVNLVRDVLRPFEVGADGDSNNVASRVAIVTFSDDYSIDIPWEDVNLAPLSARFGSLNSRIDNLATRATGGFTFLSEALRYLDSRGQFLGSTRGRTRMIHRVVVVVTDGNPTEGHSGGAAAAALRANHHASIIALGVGELKSIAELGAIAGLTPGHRHSSMRPQQVYGNFPLNDRGEEFEQFWQAICPVCAADVRDDCLRDTDCTFDAYDQCRATCCGLPSAGSTGGDDESVMATDHVVAAIVGAILVCIILMVLLMRQQRPALALAPTPKTTDGTTEMELNSFLAGHPSTYHNPMFDSGSPHRAVWVSSGIPSPFAFLAAMASEQHAVSFDDSRSPAPMLFEQRDAGPIIPKFDVDMTVEHNTSEDDPVAEDHRFSFKEEDPVQITSPPRLPHHLGGESEWV